jgi:hypothetical protein
MNVDRFSQIQKTGTPDIDNPGLDIDGNSM